MSTSQAPWQRQGISLNEWRDRNRARARRRRGWANALQTAGLVLFGAFILVWVCALLALVVSASVWLLSHA